MSYFVNYLMEANLCVCFFLLIYQMLLRKETDHRFGRAYLLLALLISVVLPVFHFQMSSRLTFEQTLPAYWLPEVQITSSTGVTVMPVNSFWFWATWTYALGALISFLVFLVRLLRIVVTVYEAPRIRTGSGWLIKLKNDTGVFSFFKFIFIGDAIPLTEGESEQIIRHEQVHIDNFHSIDILLVNILSILFWFNPCIKTYRKSLVQLHEFEADARSADGDEVDSYCRLLAKATLVSSGYPLANHFTNSLTLKRIEMMKTVKNKITKMKLISTVATAVLFCYLIACSSSNKVFDQVDELPTFGNGPQYNELYEFIGKNLRYPEEAEQSKIEGKVFVEFVVEKDGTLSNVTTVKGIGHGCDEEVIRVIKSLPKWTPGKKGRKIVRTKFTIPVIFQLPVTRKAN